MARRLLARRILVIEGPTPPPGEWHEIPITSDRPELVAPPQPDYEPFVLPIVHETHHGAPPNAHLSRS